MAPSTARNYVIGRLGSYEVPTVDRVDTCLRELRHRLAGAEPKMIPRIWADIDLLLDHRTRLEGARK